MQIRAIAPLLLMTISGCAASGPRSSPDEPPTRDDLREALLDPNDSLWSVPAPKSFDVEIQTTKGPFVIRVARDWAPIGVDRFYHLVQTGFFDDSRFYRVRAGFIVQFGLPGDPQVTKHWADRAMTDDPVRHTNTRGTIAYAMTGPDTRTTQIYINLADSTRLDAQGFSPLGDVISGMDVVDALYSGYDESAGGGMRRGRQDRILNEGNAHLDKDFPKLDRLIRASIWTEVPSLR